MQPNTINLTKLQKGPTFAKGENGMADRKKKRRDQTKCVWAIMSDLRYNNNNSSLIRLDKIHVRKISAIYTINTERADTADPCTKVIQTSLKDF